MRIVMFAVALAAAVALTGCSDLPRGRVHGTVKYRGKPLTDTTLIFIAADNQTHPVNLKADGSYEVNGVALGPVKVSVQQSLPRVQPKAEPSRFSNASKGVVDEKAGWTPPPQTESKSSGPRLLDMYTNPDSSGLVFELKEADQEWSVDLK
jgi:hypothetical protein